MSIFTRFLDRQLYGNFADRWDDDMFRDQILEQVAKETQLLDLGAGRGGKSQMNFRGSVAFVAGVDPEEVVFENEFLDEARVQVAPHYLIPYKDESFDVIFSNSVVEHLTDPEKYFQEVHRVLRPGGVFLAKTPNRQHYVAWVAACTPHWFHEFYNKLRGREEKDTFPTTYLCNDRKRVSKLAKKSELALSRFQIVEGRPEYLRLSVFTYIVGYLYERIVNATSLFEGIRCVIFFELRKSGGNQGASSRAERAVT